jgi:hypothetical protein
MKSKIILIMMLVATVFIASCGKDDDGTNQTDVINPEKFIAKITIGSETTDIEYDENKIVAAGNLLSDYSYEYLAITGTNNDPFIVINLYPPDDHPNSGDVISIQIKASAPKPWTRDKQYTTVYFAQLQYVEEYAIVSYWDDSEERDYISYNRPESMSGKVKLWREGKLLKGEIAQRIGLQSHDNRLMYITLNFELRPEDDDLTD